jgi:chemotaxis protein histidine kinase CheA
MLKGHVMVNSSIYMGTKFKIEIPYYENSKAL